MLYLVATPIGNLADFTFRAVDTLKACDYILCEDTRHSRILLDHYKIKTPLKSFHKFNEASKQKAVLEDLKEGKRIGIISDAGMPMICDPGMRIVQACRREGIDVTVIPGPSAFLTAFALAGWEAEAFQFVGFLPKRSQTLEKLLSYPGITLGYESPNRLCKTLATLAALPEETPVAVARELTKLHEEFREGTAKELLAHYKKSPPKGEIVLLLKGICKKKISDEALCSLVKKKIEIEKKSLSEAVRLVAQEYSCSRGRLYKIALASIEC
jgi:16S rRNA (cytidine1402-2'-O)-methyltransferase